MNPPHPHPLAAPPPRAPCRAPPDPRGKATILGQPIIALARALCARDAYLLAWSLYQQLDGQSFTPYQGCGLGLLMSLRDLMGEDPAEIGATILV